MYYFSADTQKHTHTDTHTDPGTQTNKLNTITLLCKIKNTKEMANSDEKWAL